MSDEPTPWPIVVAAVEAELHAWRAAHPAATLHEIETRLDARLREVRSGLVAELAQAVPATESERCPQCEGVLLHRGERTRTLRTQGDVPLALRRAYLTCPACGTGVFPPG